jgi:hypothetical protein
VENEQSAGLSSTLAFSGLANTQPRKGYSPENAGALHLKSGEALCQYVYSDMLLEASVGMAAINSYVNAKLPFHRLKELNAFDLILKHGKDKNVAVIGHFPFVPKLKKSVKKLHVFELFPKDGNDLSPSQFGDVLPICDVVAITGTTLLNHSLNDVLEHTAPDAYKIMLGPSTPMTPLLFDYGFDALCGSFVVDHTVTRNHISQAVPFKKIQGIKHLTLEATEM